MSGEAQNHFTYSAGMESDESDDDDTLPRLKKGWVRVAWHPDGTEEVTHEDKIKLMDRSLMPGNSFMLMSV